MSLNAENIDLGESTITALGDLTLSANGTLTVKDLNALGDLILQGSELIIELEDGRTVDMICGGDFVVDAAVVTTVGDGTFRFAPTTGIELMMRSCKASVRISRLANRMATSMPVVWAQDPNAFWMPVRSNSPHSCCHPMRNNWRPKPPERSENLAWLKIKRSKTPSTSQCSPTRSENLTTLGIGKPGCHNVGGGDNRPISIPNFGFDHLPHVPRSQHIKN